MKISPRRMKQYKPRRRRSNKVLQYQQLIDIEKVLEMDLGTFIILMEEGSKKQAEKARLKMRSHLLKYGSDLKAIARNLGEGFPELVNQYLMSMDSLIKQSTTKIDMTLLNTHRKQALELKKKAA